MHQAFPAIPEALELSASAQVRNMASIGGNLVQPPRWLYCRDVSATCNRRNPGTGRAPIAGHNRTHAATTLRADAEDKLSAAWAAAEKALGVRQFARTTVFWTIATCLGMLAAAAIESLTIAAHAPLLVWVQTVAFPSTQEHGYAELRWKILAKLVASELATKTDSDVIQVIAEHAALGEQATDEGGPSVGSEGDA